MPFYFLLDTHIKHNSWTNRTIKMSLAIAQKIDREENVPQQLSNRGHAWIHDAACMSHT
jgi:hypothetical protein